MRKALIFFMLAGAAAAQDQPTFRATTSEVLLDLVVRDKNGRAVKNLKPGDVEIYEDGVLQQIRSMRLVEGRDQKAGDAKPARAAARPLRAVNPVCIVFHNLAPVERKRAIEAVQELLRRSFPPETYVGVFVLDDRLKPIFPFTSDPKALAEAIATVYNRGSVDYARAMEPVLSANPNQFTVTTTVNMAAHTAETTAQPTGGELSTTATLPSAATATSPGANVIRGVQVDEQSTFTHITGMRATDRIIHMIDQLGALPGHKTVLLLTQGLATTGDPERFQSILAKANGAGITVYGLDARGLDMEESTLQSGNRGVSQAASVSRTQGEADSPLSVMRQRSRQLDDMKNAVRTADTQASLRALSEGTGGFIIANTNDFRKPFQRIVEDVGTHYEVSYKPASEKLDGKLRSIAVKPVRSELRVESRTGYFAVPDAALPPVENLALGVLNTQPRQHAFELRTASYHFRSDAGNPQSAVAFEIPAAALAATSDPARKMNRIHVSMLALVKGADGQVAAKLSVDAPYDIPDANLAAVKTSAITHTRPLKLAPGRYTVETAAIDREGRRMSTGTTALEVPAPREGVGISDVVLVQRVEPAGPGADPSDPLVFQGQRAIPLLAGTLAPDAQPLAFFVVYPGKASTAKPKIQVEFLVGGQVLAQQEAELPAPDATGAIPMMIGAATRPGDCELRITAIQGGDSIAKSVKYAVAAN